MPQPLRTVACPAFVLGCAVAIAAAAQPAIDCATAPPDAWLLGSWQAEKQIVTFRREGGRLTWRYERGPGLVTQRWGLKATATAEGTVAAARGCEVEMTGRYVAYGGTPRALGSPMNYVVALDGSGSLSGTGIGFGREPFQVRWRRIN